MTDIFKPSTATLQNARISRDQYEAMYKGSVNQPEIFWAVQAKRLDWIKKPTKIKNTSFEAPVSIKWYEDGVLNACYNCVDRHLKDKAGQTAIIWEGDNPAEDRRLTFAQLHGQICRLANALKSRGVKKGDRVTIYMPMVPEAAVAILACARIGAVHSVVFGGFSPESLKDRILAAVPAHGPAPVHGAPAAKVRTDGSGLIEWVNAEFTAMCGYELAELRGRKPGTVLQGAASDRQEIAALRAAIREVRPIEAELVNYHKNGSPYRVHIAITPICDDDQKPLFYVAKERRLPLVAG